MKLAEALQERADLNSKIEMLRGRLRANATKQEGEEPPEDPAALLETLEAAILRLEELIAKINAANSRTAEQGRTITEWIARKDALRINVAVYSELIAAASQVTFRSSPREIKILPAVDVREMRNRYDAAAKELRQVDNLIQAANWRIDI